MQEGNAKLLIIASSVERARPAANYLNRRGVGCGVVSSVRASLDFIRQYKPEYVMLSWNLPGTNVPKIMEVLSQTFQVTVILFSETQDSKTATQLTATNHRHILHAPVSGTKIQIKLTQIEKEKMGGSASELTTSSASNDGAVAKDDNGRIVIKSHGSNSQAEGSGPYRGKGAGGNEANGIAYMGSSKSAGNALEKVNRGNLEGDTDVAFRDGEHSEDEAEAGETWPELNGAGEVHETGPHFPEGLPHKQRGGLRPPDRHRQGGLLAKQIADSDEKKKSLSYLDKSSSAGSRQQGEDSPGAATAQSKEQSLVDHTSGPKKKLESEAVMPAHEAKPKGMASGQSESGAKGKKGLGVSWQQAPPATQKNSTAKSKERNQPGASGGPKSEPLRPRVDGPQRECLLAQAVARALQQVSVPDGMKQDIRDIRRVQVMAIQSPRYRGYLLTARTGDIEIDEAFLLNLRKAILLNLEVVGEKVNGEKMDFSITVKSFPFVEWAGGEAEFLARAQHGDTEVAMAFLSGEEAFADFSGGLTIEGMTGVDLKVFPDEESVEFDVFLFMPLNNKFFRYVRSGLKMLAAQKGRLKDQKILQVFVRVKDRKKLSVAYGKKFIRKRIEKPEPESSVEPVITEQRSAA